MHRNLTVIFCGLLLLSSSAAPGTGGDVCQRFASGSTVGAPAEVRTSNGRLHITLAFRSQVDDYGLTRYCYVDSNGREAPTLRARPGDEIVLDLKNEASVSGAAPAHQHTGGDQCTIGPMAPNFTNVHFHGLEIPPLCHQDDVLHTLIQPSEPPFQYRFKIPAGQPPGLYWYHPHPHGYSESQVLGGASGALIVDGIEQWKPQVTGLPERLLILRDQLIPDQRGARKSEDQDDLTGKDVSLNFVPIQRPIDRPAVVRVQPDRREFWRLLNASADTYFALQLITVENGLRSPHILQLIAIDGVPVADEVSSIAHREILMSPGSRAEFILTTPHSGAFSQLISRSYNTGPDGAANSGRVIANIISAKNHPETESSSANEPSAQAAGRRFTGLTGIKPATVRKLYFSEDREDLRTPGKLPKYFITVEGKKPAVFDMNFKEADIRVLQGTVEDWIIENRAREAHVFHIHQIHFQMLGRDGAEVAEPMLRDTIDIPYWDGISAQYPKAKLRMDFRAPEIVGTFLFHCHILEHEDAGMMGSVQVVKSRSMAR